MQTIEELIREGKTIKDVVQYITENSYTENPKWEELEKMYDANKHSIMDAGIRKDKLTKDGVDKVSRVKLSLQKLAVKRMAEMCFALPVKRTYSYETEEPILKDITKSIEKIYKKVRIDDTNLERAREYFATCQIATIWYIKEEDNSIYGFKAKHKLRIKTYSERKGHKLYPLFDEQDDLIAFSISYSKKEKDKTINYFETITKDRIYKWKEKGTEWEEISNIENVIKKINVIYLEREESIYEEVSHLVDEIEWTLSRNSDIIAYNAAPLIEVKGQLEGMEAKGQERRIWVVSENGGVRYVSWEQSIDAIKYQIESLLMLYFLQLQLPNLSFENIKGLSTLSGESIKNLLTDAHLKVGDEAGMLTKFLDREFNVVKAFVGTMNTAWASHLDKIDCEHEIQPFVMNDKMAEIDRLLKANGQKALMSQKESIEVFGQSNDVEKTYNEILEEDDRSSLLDKTGDLFE